MDGISRPAGPHLGVDVGTSNTAAALRIGNGEIRPLLFDRIPLLPSAVFVDGATVLVGTDAYLLDRVRVEAERVAGAAPHSVILTYPATWGRAGWPC